MPSETLNAAHPPGRIAAFIDEAAASSDVIPSERLAAQFETSALELFRWQYLRNPAYGRYCRSQGRTPDSVSSWREVPVVPVAAFKDFDFTCLSTEDRPTVFHSSGTTLGKPSRHFHNADSLALYHASLVVGFKRHFPIGEIDCCLLSLTPAPWQAPRSSLVHMLDAAAGQTCKGNSRFEGEVGKDETWHLAPKKAVSWLKRQCILDQAIIVAGTAFHFVELMDWMTAEDVRVQLPPGSSILETGGYKGRSRVLEKSELYDLITRRLVVPIDRIVSEYGMSELSSQAYDAVAGQTEDRRLFRFPEWVRCRVVSPETGREVPEGQAGLLQVFDLANAYSVMAVQTEDCVIPYSDGFEFVGREERAEPKGCSLMMN